MTMQTGSKEAFIEEAIRRFGLCYDEILLPAEIMRIYDTVQPDNEISLRHIEEALLQVTSLGFCSKMELTDVMQELDRRNFLLRDLKWEFAFLDYERSGGLPIDRGYFLFSAMHGKHLDNIWKEFISKRQNPESRLTFEELSVILCSIFDENDDTDINDSM